MASKSSGFLKKIGANKIVVIATLVLGVVGITYTTVPQVKDFVDNTIDKVAETFGVKEGQNLEQLEKVTNIEYDETTRQLTFDENLKARGYKVNIIHKNGGISVDAQAGVVTIPTIEGIQDGDILSFEVIAVGDYTTTKNSEKATYEHTVQFASKMLYELTKLQTDEMIKRFGVLASRIRFQTGQVTSYNIDGDILTIEGQAKNHSGSKVNFTVTYDLSKYEERDFSNPTNYLELLRYLTNRTAQIISIDAKISQDFVSMKDVLESAGAFEEYTSQGYSIETVQFAHSNLQVLEESTTITYTATYRATNALGNAVTFTQENKITVDGQHNSIEEFAVAAGQSVSVTQEAKQELDQVLNNHLEKTNQAQTTKTATNSQDMEF